MKEVGETEKVQEAGWRHIISVDKWDTRLTLAKADALHVRKELFPCITSTSFPKIHPPSSSGL